MSMFSAIRKTRLAPVAILFAVAGSALLTGLLAASIEAGPDEQQIVAAVKRAGGQVRFDDGSRVVSVRFEATDNCMPDNALLAKIAGLSHLRELHFIGEVDPTLGVAASPARPPDREKQRAALMRSYKKYYNKLSPKRRSIVEQQLRSMESTPAQPKVPNRPSNLVKPGNVRVPRRGKLIKHPEVTDAGICCLKDLKELMVLDLSGTAVQGPALACLAGMHPLIGLDLSFVNLQDTDLVHVSGLSNLRWLLLEGDGITDAGMASLGKLTDLTTLSVRSRTLTDRGLSQLRLPHLDSLTLTSPNVRNLGFLAGLTGLTTLDIRGTAVTDEGFAPIIKLTAMRILMLSDTPIGDAALVHISKLTRMVTLDLRNTRITDQGLAALATLSQCELINVSETAVTINGASALAMKLPNTKILY